MKSLRKNAIAFVALALAPVLVFGFGSYKSHKQKRTASDEKSELERARSLEMQLNQVVAQAITSGSNMQSPIKVRGGSMTAYTTVSGGWTTMDRGVTYCVLVNDVTYLEYDGDSLEDASGNDIPSVSTPWDLKLTGKLPADAADHVSHHRGDDSKRGFKLHGDKKDCNNNPIINGGTHGSVTLSLIGGIGAAFYPLPSDPNNQYESERFWDKSSDCMNEPDNTGKGDRDFCEQMSRVVLTMGGADMSQDPCPDGDCEIWAGGPPA